MSSRPEGAVEGSRYWKLERAVGVSVEESCNSEAVPFVKDTELLPIYGHLGRELGKYLSLSFPSILTYWYLLQNEPNQETEGKGTCSLYPQRSATQDTGQCGERVERIGRQMETR